MTEDQEKQLHNEARAYAEKRRGLGAVFDKKALRWNDVVAVGNFYAKCGAKWTMAVAISGVREAIDACVKDDGSGVPDPQYSPGRGPLTMIQGWMVA